MDLVDGVREALRASADPEKAGAMQAYMKSEMPFLGIQKGSRTKALRPVFADSDLDHDALVEAATRLWDGAEYREERYAALALLRVPKYRRMLTSADEPLLRHLITTGAWWDLVDETATKLVGPLRDDLDVRAWARDENIWIRRAAIICQVGGRGRTTDRDLLADAIEVNLGDRTFWITKAIGWALRDYAYSDPAWVADFVVGHDLAPLSAREATKHL